MTTEADVHVSPAEEGLWLLQHLAGDRGVSNLSLEVHLPYTLPDEFFARAMRHLVRRHPALGATFPLHDGEIRRARLDERRAAEISQARSPAPGEDPQALLLRAAGESFDLERGPLVRLVHVRVPDDATLAVLTIHHLIGDGSTQQTLVDELLACLDGLRTSGMLPRLGPAPAWVPPAQPEAESVVFWQEHVRGYQPAGATLDAAQAPVAAPSFRADRACRRLSARTAEDVRALRRRLRASDHMVLLSAFYVDLVRHGASNDLVIGVLVNIRVPHERHAVGYGVNTVPLRLTTTAGVTFADVVRATRAATEASLPHLTTPYETLLRHGVTFAEPGDWWQARLFRHLFNFRLNDSLAIGTSGSSARVADLHHGLGQHDLELTLQRHGADLDAILVYGTDVHDAAFAEALLARFEHILQLACADPEAPVADYDLRTGADIELVAAANRTDRQWPAGSVLDRIRQRTGDHPAATAVVEDGEEISYGGLLGAAEAVREVLVTSQVRPGDVVALVGTRGARTAAAVLAIWAAGAAYFPIDPAHPVHRSAAQLDELDCRVLVGDDAMAPELRHGRTVITVPSPLAGAASGLGGTEPMLDAPAYVISTSGSTGTPKGVRLTHGNLINVVEHFGELLGVGAGTTGLWLTTFSFDISALELFLPLTAGGRVVVVPDDARTRPDAVLAVVDQYDVDVIQATPTTWRIIGPSAVGRLSGRRVLCGGEALTPDVARVLMRTGGRVYNVYGPTETTIWSTVAELGDPSGPVTVGRPLANTRVEILDPAHRPLPPFVKGELGISGAGVADGYWNRPALTDERFVTIDGIGRCYRTGDVASWTGEGTLVLHGRDDRQVKIRGHRIELGEVEQALTAHPGVRSAVAVTVGGLLVAYVEPAGAAPSAEDLWRCAAAELPAYALPERLVVVDALPTTRNAKLDIPALVSRAAVELAAEGDRLNVTAADGPRGHQTLTRPDHGTVETLVSAWRSVLGRAAVDRDTHFFLGGGNSLMALRLIEEVQKATDQRIRLLTLFSAPTPAKLAAVLDQKGAAPGD